MPAVVFPRALMWSRPFVCVHMRHPLLSQQDGLLPSLRVLVLYGRSCAVADQKFHYFACFS